MKKFLTIIYLLTLSLVCLAQAQITTKKEKLSDFTLKTTKIVLGGKDFLDQPLREAANNSWTISPFEFCSMDEFNSLRGNENYYFLLPVAVLQKGESGGITYLSLYKGRSGAASLDDLTEVVSFPLCAADIPSGREASYLPAVLDIMQTYVDNALTNGFGSIAPTRKISGTSNMRIYFTEDDLSQKLDPKYRSRKFDSETFVVEEETASNIVLDGAPGALVSYTVSPAEPSDNSECYVMLIDARSHELCYFKKHKGKAGFQKGDISKITARRHK